MPWAVVRAAHSQGRGYLSRTSIVNPLYSSDSLTLRPVKFSDAHDYLKCACDDQVTKFLYMETMTTEDEALALTKHLMTDPCMAHVNICMNDRSVGFVSTFNHKGHKAEIGYCLARKYWGQGIMTQALKMSVNMVLKDFPEIVRLEAFADVENIGSQRVFEKAGFKKRSS
nr:acyl-CoA N-acyltransferases (NAT) superfamily protein [Tanacetum cinerariifolium]